MNMARNALQNVDSLADDPAAKYIIGRLPLARVGEKSTTDQAKSWIEECLNSHKDCPSLERHLLPTRVIDVKADSVQGGARLHISTENETADYATLSYCWGEATGSVILTTATLEAWKERLPVENLPRSLQDAVKITRDLGIRYLWVDALCIVQEDIGEKKKEIERMGKIYKNSLVTIAAANSRSASDGFLSDRDLPGVTTLPFPCPNGTTGKISLAKFVSTYHPEQPLDRRAWALQEYLLSPRLLMYGASELTWHCQTQAFHKVGESHLLYWPFINRLPPEIFNPGYPTPEDAPRSRQELWASIVRDYSGRLLTYPEDKASAIAGVANELSEAWNDEYVWGAWKGDLVFYLAWYRDPGVARNITRSERAPSWSWLSLDCEVVFLPTRRRILARVVQYPLAQPEMPSEPRHDAGTRLVIRAKILTTDELDSGELKTWNIIRDLSNESSVEAKSYFLLLGIWWDKDPLCLVLKSLDNGTFRRVGSAFNCKTYKWDSLPDETITLV